ncbi:MAG TPA: hypothetical protein VFF60_03775, partial [Candidatus Binatus sp.]|nr:hypothetical protein [Candidatus Binatus sp.]
MRRLFALVALVPLLAACVPESSKKPPDAQLPTTYRGEASTQSSMGAIPWQQLYDDPVLQKLIQQALVKNYT